MAEPQIHDPVQVSNDNGPPDEGFFATSDIDQQELKRMIEDEDWRRLEEQNVKRTDTLSLSCCELRALPREVLSLEKLTRLYLSHNKLKSLPEQFAELVNMEILSIGFNAFSEIPPAIFELKKLKVLFMKNNKLTSNGIGQQISGLNNLEELYLDNNSLEKIPEQLCKIQNLHLLTLANNDIEEIPDDIGCMQKLKVLQMRCNRLKKVPDVFGDLKTLELACFAQNMIDTFPLDKVASLPSLRDLCLYANRLRDKDALEGCAEQFAERGGMFRAEENRVSLPRMGGVCDSAFKIWKIDLLWLHDDDPFVKQWVDKMSDMLRERNLTPQDCGPHEEKIERYMKLSRILGVICTRAMCGLLIDKTAVRGALEKYFEDSKEPAVLLVVYDKRAGISPFLVSHGCHKMVTREPNDDEDREFFERLAQNISKNPRI